MGNCTYCGKPAGFLRSKHTKCERLVAEGKERIAAESSRVIRGTESFTELEKTITEIETTSLIPNSERNALLINAWEASVDQFLEDGVLDESEEKRLAEFMKHFALSKSDLDKNGALTRTAKAAVLRRVLNGVVPRRASVDEDIPINFQKDERVVWAFPESEYFEDKTKRQYVGGSKGLSIRIMKGVYYRVGDFKGHAVDRTERVHIDTGWVVVTSKHIYFSGAAKTFRVPYSKIISFLPFSDGFGILRDAATAKPQIFITGDGWFSYNLVTNLARL